MESLIAGGAGVLVVGFLIWLAFRAAKQQGAAEERAESEAAAREVEQEMGQVVAERRETSETKKRLDDGTF